HMSTLPNFTLPGDTASATRYWGDEDIVEERLDAVAGAQSLPASGPGLGVTRRRDLLESKTLRKQEVCRRRLPSDARQHRLELQQVEQGAVYVAVAGHQHAVAEAVGPAVVARDRTAGLAHDQHPRGGVPGVQAQLPEAVQPAGGDVAEVERRGPGAAHAVHLRQDAREHLEVELDAVLDVGEAGAEQRPADVGGGAHRQRAAVQPRAAALRGGEELVPLGVVDDAYD